MKFLTAQMLAFLKHGETRRNLRLLWRFLILLLIMTVAYSLLFHVLMAAEGQDHSWITGFYWTLTVMSTLGFGDITFQSDAGRVFSIVVLLSGVFFLLIVLPFTFIQFFYAPWLEAQTRQRAPRSVRNEVSGHIIITNYDPVASSLVRRLGYHHIPYFVTEPDSARALALHDQGVSVVVGEPDDAATYQRMRVSQARMVVATGDDYMNTNVAFTVRELNDELPIVTFARAPESVDVLELAGSTHVLRLTDMLGRSLARRTLGGDVRANTIGRFGELLIVEAPVLGTPLVGKTVGEGWVRDNTGLTVVGVWKRGRFETLRPDTVIDSSMVLVLAGSEEQVARFAELTAIYSSSDAPVLILGGGRVGRAAGAALADSGIPYKIVEKDPGRVRDPQNYVVGDAADLQVLERAGIQEAPTAIVTTADDPTNIYLTIYVRRLRPDIQIISRATLEHNVSTLHRAGADFVMSYASMGANAVYNILEQDDVVMVAEGLDVFRVKVPPQLVGTTLEQSGIRADTGCSVVALETKGETIINPPADMPLPGGTSELILVGTTESQREFIARYFK
ncbi:MAG TPA: NAD-binding protein [Longimicrobiales bacterium]|nr:NAD-binding protein [Longimicrobiales bacterium]